MITKWEKKYGKVDEIEKNKKWSAPENVQFQYRTLGKLFKRLLNQIPAYEDKDPMNEHEINYTEQIKLHGANLGIDFKEQKLETVINTCINQREEFDKFLLNHERSNREKDLKKICSEVKN